MLQLRPDAIKNKTEIKSFAFFQFCHLTSALLMVIRWLPQIPVSHVEWLHGMGKKGCFSPCNSLSAGAYNSHSQNLSYLTVQNCLVHQCLNCQVDGIILLGLNLLRLALYGPLIHMATRYRNKIGVLLARNKGSGQKVTH